MRSLWVMAVLLFGLLMVGAQDEHYQIFRTESDDPNAVGAQTISFVNSVTGDITEATVYGFSYTIVGHEVMFFDRLANQVAIIAPDGSVRPHPFIQPGGATRRVDWVVSDDRRLIAWTLTEGADSTSLTTITTVANMDGTNPKQVLVDGPRNGIRAMPVGFSGDHSALYMDYQPDGLGDYTPYSEYAGLFELRFKENAEVDYLPDEPGCFCGGGFGGDFFLRLALNDDLSGFNLRVFNLSAQTDVTIDAVNLQNYTQGGDILVAPDGSAAVYALAQVTDFGAPDQVVRTVYVLVDLQRMTQRTLTQPQTNVLRPVAWTEANTAIIFISPNAPGTWKMDVETGRLTQIATATYLGTTSIAGT